jgi:Zn-dependent protease with chaperone function
MSAFKKSLLCVVVLCSLHHVPVFSYSFFSPAALLDRYLAKHYGAQPVSEWYQDKCHEFLNYLDVQHSEDIPVRNVALSPQIMRLASQTFFDKIPAFTLATGIWINEEVLENVPEEVKLWVIAHESAHYSQGHGISNLIMANFTKWMPAVVVTAMTGATLLGFNWLSNKIDHLERNRNRYQKIVFIFASIYFGSGMIQAAQQVNLAYFESQKLFEKEADLAAAKMLCDHGCVSVVEHHLQALKDAVARGFIMLNGCNHPTFQEQVAYVQEFWDEYVKHHPELQQETVVETGQ